MVTISKVTALQRLEIDGEPKFYAFTDKFLSEKEEISEENFWDLRLIFQWVVIKINLQTAFISLVNSRKLKQG